MWASSRRSALWVAALWVAALGVAFVPGSVAAKAKERPIRRSVTTQEVPAPANAGQSGAASEHPSDAASTLALDLGGLSLELVLLPAGSFRQGSPATERARGTDEGAHEVSLSEAFFIGKYEVTVAQFAAFVDATGYRTETERGSSGGFGWDGQKLTQDKRYYWREPGYPQSPQHPVGLVTFADAQAFTNWLSQRTGCSVALPTEAQWEYAYRAGTSTRFYSGDEDAAAASIGWFLGNAPAGAHAVGELKPNAVGLYDLAGNLYEWCQDWYGPYEPGERATDPLQSTAPAGDKPRRVLRGGSFLRGGKDLRAAARYRNDPGSRNADNGFRVVASLSAAPVPAAGGGAQRELVPERATSSQEIEAQDSGWSPVKLALFGGAGLFGGTLLFGLVQGWRQPRRRRTATGSSGSSTGSAADVTVRHGKDGFWLIAPERMRGHMLHYRVDGPTGATRSAIELEPSPNGQFVYTGYQPGSVRIEQVLLAGGAAGAAWNAAQLRQQELEDEEERQNDERRRARVHSSSRRYPSAY